MAKDFDLDVQALTTQEGDGKEPRIKSVVSVYTGLRSDSDTLYKLHFLLVHKEK
ncbi:MAG: hypothetical protein ACLVAT_07960 [Lachnospiraceae bacterium]